MTERRSASAGTGWDADVLATDPTEGVGSTETDGVTSRPLGTLPPDDDVDETGEPEVDVLVMEIAETRAEMADTVDALGQRLEPAAIADRAKDRVREATIGTLEEKVDDMTTAVSNVANETTRTAQDVGSGVVETIKRNPVPAALAGIGIGWLVMNRRSASPHVIDGEWTGDDRRMTGSSGFRGGANARTSGLSRGASELGDRVGDAADEARRTASEAASTIGDTAERTASHVSRTASDALGDAQRMVESNPLAFGAIAVAVGAAVGLAVPATEAEKRVMSGPGTQLIDKAASAVEQPFEEMERSSSN